MKEHLASEILRFLADEKDIKFFSYDTTQWIGYECHEPESRWSWYATSEDKLKLLVCDVPSDDFEDRCKAFLDMCFETAQLYDVIACSYDAGRRRCVLKKGTCLEEVLIQMDLETC